MDIDTLHELTWDEFIDADFTYGEPKAESREQVESLWKLHLSVNPGDWKFYIKGPYPVEDTEGFLKHLFLEEAINFENHTVTLHLKSEPE